MNKKYAVIALIVAIVGVFGTFTYTQRSTLFQGVITKFGGPDIKVTISSAQKNQNGFTMTYSLTNIGKTSLNAQSSFLVNVVMGNADEKTTLVSRTWNLSKRAEFRVGEEAKFTVEVPREKYANLKNQTQLRVELTGLKDAEAGNNNDVVTLQ